MDSGTQIRFDHEGSQRLSGARGRPPGGPDCAAKLADFARSHHQSLLRFFTQRLGSREEARDLVQGTYVKVLTADHPGGIRDFEGYVWRSALNLATDWGRHRAVHALYAQSVVDAPVDLGRSVENEIEARERLDVVVRAYEALSPRCQDAFTLRVLEGRPFKEVGRIMGISDRMAKIYVARARASIGDAFEHADRRVARAAQPPMPARSGGPAVPPRRSGYRGEPGRLVASDAAL